jgi:hypothetical protein
MQLAHRLYFLAYRDADPKPGKITAIEPWIAPFADLELRTLTDFFCDSQAASRLWILAHAFMSVNIVATRTFGSPRQTGITLSALAMPA